MCCECGQEKLLVSLRPGVEEVSVSRARQERVQALLSPGVSIADRTLSQRGSRQGQYQEELGHRPRAAVSVKRRCAWVCPPRSSLC